MSKPTTRIQQQKRAIILAAGLDVFSKSGFRGATLDQIAEAAGMSKPNLLYYFPSKEAVHETLLDQLLDMWLAPLHAISPSDTPIEELLDYAQSKLDLSRDYPRESRLFANEILQGAPRLSGNMGALKTLVDEKVTLIQGWIDAGAIAQTDPYHLIFSIWALTQHYADFDVQIRAVRGNDDPFDGASDHIDRTFRRLLTPSRENT